VSSIKNIPKDKLSDALKSIIKGQASNNPEILSVLVQLARDGKKDWWKLSTDYKVIKNLKDLGLIITKNGNEYELFDHDLVKSILEELGYIKYKPTSEGPTFPISIEDLNQIVGYDEIKRTIIMALRSKKPVHILLTGPPGIGKSLFLDSIRKALKKKNSCVEHVEAVKGLSTSVGIADLLLSMDPEVPCALLIDEIDKLDQSDLALLLRLMETGEIMITKHGKRITEERKVWIIAASNNEKALIAPMLDRFLIFKFRSLTKDEYKRLVPSILTVNEEIDIELARYIADKLADISTDIREAIRISRLAKSKDDVDFLIKQILQSRRSLLSP
jgi:energy-coupling factor transporter ATP-binding protein EcfA2